MSDYKLQWEMVRISNLHKYSNADPMFYKNTTQTVPNSQIPDEDWNLTIVEFDEDQLESRTEQYNNLKQWADADEQFVRNVKLYKLAGEPQWEEITP